MGLKFTNQERTAATFNNRSFTLSAPEDWEAIGDGPTREAVLAWLAEGNTPEPLEPPTFQQQVDANTATVQAKLDDTARSKGYDDIVSACSYAAQAAGAPFQAEGAAFLQWRSAVWAKAYATLEDVRKGLVPLPSPAEAVASMPALVLP